MNTRKIVLLLVVPLLIALLIVPLSCAKETKTYSKYDVSFEYPKDWDIVEMGILTAEPNTDNGLVQVSGGMLGDEADIFEVVWMSQEYELLKSSGGVRGILENHLMAMEGLGSGARLDRGELVQTNKKGHEMLYQDYTLTFSEGQKAQGVVGALYCDKTLREFILITTVGGTSVKQDLLDDFQRYLDSFAGH